MAYRRTSQISATTGGRRRRLNQIEAMNARLDFLPQIEAMKSAKKYQAKAEARETARDTASEARYQAGLVKTKEAEVLAATKYEEAKKFKKKQTKTALGLEATKLGTSLMGTGPTVSSVPGSLKSTFSGGITSPTITPPSAVSMSGTGRGGTGGLFGGRDPSGVTTTPVTPTATGGGGTGFFNKAKSALGGTTIGSALGSGLTGYGAAQIFSDKSEKTKMGWGAAAGGIAGLIGGGGLGGMFSGALFGGIGGALA